MSTTAPRSVVLGLAAALMLMGAATATASASYATPFRATIHEETAFAACPAGTPSTMACSRGTGTGHATHLGRTREQSFTILDIAHPNPATGCISDVSQVTLAAANGNLLFLTALGTFCPTSPTFAGTETGTFTIIGGTGRFAGARGAGTFQATIPVGLTPSGIIASTTVFNGTLTRN